MVKPNKQYGQNFLKNPQILARQISYAEVGNQDSVLEIGPGTGNLTERLAKIAREVHAIEIDPQFHGPLNQLQGRFRNLHLIWADALDVSFPPFTKIVANLPYQIALPLIFKILDHDFEIAVLIVQQRLARRLCAKAGEEGYSRISVNVQRLAEATVLEIVKPQHFEPAPEVESAMIRLRKTPSRFSVPSQEALNRTLDALFLQRDKTVGIAINRLFPDRAAPSLKDLGRLCDRPVSLVRPEEFGRICQILWQRGLVPPVISNEMKKKAQKYAKAGRLPRFHD
jgi:16S rRNA (adenine1518-N6/adenine1519-N6)-dimethyltransferase